MDFLSETIRFIVNVISYIQHMPPEVLQAVGAMIGVTVLTQRLKRWIATQSRTVVTMILGVVSFIPVTIDYIASQAAANPGVLAPRTVMIMGGSTVIYNTVGKWIIGILADAKTLREQNQVATPVTAEPTATTFE